MCVRSTEKIWFITKRKLSTETGSEIQELIKLADRNFETAIINVTKDLKENVNIIRRNLIYRRESLELKIYNIWNIFKIIRWGQQLRRPVKEKSSGDITIEFTMTETQGKNTQKIKATMTKGTLLHSNVYLIKVPEKWDCHKNDLKQ